MATQQKLHIGQMIKAVFDESGMSVAELARRIHCDRTNVYSIFDRSSIDLQLLIDISNALGHNFLDDAMLQSGLKSSLCPRLVQINLDLEGLSHEKARQAALLLQFLSHEDV